MLPKPWFNRGIGLLLDVKKLSKVQLFVDAAVFLSVCIVAEQISAKLLHLVIQATDLAHMFMLGYLY